MLNRAQRTDKGVPVCKAGASGLGPREPIPAALAPAWAPGLCLCTATAWNAALDLIFPVDKRPPWD